jgi:hypothetical protein
MKRVGLFSKYSPKVSNVCAVGTWALSQVTVDEGYRTTLVRSPAFVCTLARIRARNSDLTLDPRLTDPSCVAGRCEHRPHEIHRVVAAPIC